MAIKAFLSRSPGLLNRGPGAQPLWDMFLIPASSLQLVWTSCRRGYIIIWRPLFFALNSTPRQSRLYPDIPRPDVPVIYTGVFPILTAWLGRRSIYNNTSLNSFFNYFLPCVFNFLISRSYDLDRSLYWKFIAFQDGTLHDTFIIIIIILFASFLWVECPLNLWHTLVRNMRKEKVQWMAPYAGRPYGTKDFCFFFWILGMMESNRADDVSAWIYWLQDFEFQLRKVEFIFLLLNSHWGCLLVMKALALKYMLWTLLFNFKKLNCSFGFSAG